MRALLSPAILLAATLGAASCASNDPRPSAPLRCQDGGDEDPREAVVDRQITQRLVAGARRLMADEKVQDLETLKEQLSRRGPVELELPRPAAGPRGLRELYADAADRILVTGQLYKCDRCTRWHNRHATAFPIAPGVCVTNHHVVDGDGRTLVVMTRAGEVLPVTEVLCADPANDLAIIRVEGLDLAPFPLAAIDPGPGENVAVISHPDGRYYTLSAGIVARYHPVHRAGAHPAAMSITADYARGSSGAAVLDRSGAVVGICATTSSIYYEEQAGVQKNLQMVVKDCTPVSAVRALVRAKGGALR